MVSAWAASRGSYGNVSRGSGVQPRSSSSSGSRALDAEIGTDSPSTSTVSTGGRTYVVEQRDGQYYAREEGSNVWGEGSASAQSAQQSAARTQSDVSRATPQIGWAAQYTRDPYTRDASGKKWTEGMLSHATDEATAAGLRYAAAVNAPKKQDDPSRLPLPTITSEPPNYGPPGGIDRREVYTPAVTYLPDIIGQLPATPAGLSAGIGEVERESKLNVFLPLFSQVYASNAAKAGTDITTEYTAFKETWGESPVFETAEDAYKFTMAREALSAKTKGIEGDYYKNVGLLESTNLQISAVNKAMPKATAALDLKFSETGEAMAEIKRQRSAAAVSSLLDEPGSLATGGEWGAFGTVFPIAATAAKNVAAGNFANYALTGLMGKDVIASGFTGAIGGMAYEGGKMLGSWWIKEGVKSGQLSEASMEAHVVPRYGESGLVQFAFDELPTLERRAKEAPTLGQYYTSQLRGDDKYSGYMIYEPERGVKMYREAIGVSTGFVALEAAPVAASIGSKWLMNQPSWQAFRGTIDARVKGIPEVLPGEPLSVSEPKSVKQIAKGELMLAKDAKLSGNIDVRVDIATGPEKGTWYYKTEQWLNQPIGGARYEPYQVRTTIESFNVEDVWTRAIYSKPTTAEGDIQSGIEIARTRYLSAQQPMEPGMPSGPSDVWSNERITLTHFQTMGTGKETVTLPTTRTWGIQQYGEPGINTFTDLRAVAEKSGRGFDFTTIDFGGTVTTQKSGYGLTGRMFTTPISPDVSKFKFIPPSGGPKTPLDFGTKIGTAIDTTGAATQIPVSTGVELPASNVWAGSVRAAGAAESASMKAIEETTVFLATPPSFSLPGGGVLATEMRMDDTVFGSAFSFKTSPPPSGAKKFKQPQGKMDELEMYRTVPLVTPSITWDYQESVLTEERPRIYPGEQRQLIGQIEGMAQPSARIAEPMTRVSELTGTLSETRVVPEQRIVPELGETRIPQFNFDFKFGEGEIVPPPGIGGAWLGPSLKDDPFRGSFLGAPRKGRKGGARLPVMANLFQVFEYEGRTGREFVHPRSQRAEAAFSESLATGTDFFATKGMYRGGTPAKQFTLGLRGKKKSRSKKGGLKLW